MWLGVGFPVLPEESWLAHSPSLGSWVALAALVAMIAAYTLVRRAHNTSTQTASRELPRIEEHARRVWLTLALLGPGLAVLSDAHLLAVAWWFVAGPAFSTVLLVSVGLLMLILAHPRQALVVPPHQRVGTSVVSGLLVAATLCIPLAFVAISSGTDWRVTTSLTCAMGAGYGLAVIADLLVQHWGDSDDTAAEPA